MSKNSERELLEVVEWYTLHKHDDMSIEKRLQFLTKAMDFMLWAMGRVVEDVQCLEGRKRNGVPMGHDPYIMKAIPKNLRTTTGSH